MYKLNWLFFVIAMLCAIATVEALHAQYYLGFEPCPLCMVQRLIIVVVTFIAVIAWLHKNKSRIVTGIYSSIILVLALCGIKVAAHHQWLVSLPLNQQPLSCGMPLEVMYHALPFTDFMQKILAGDAECGVITWRVLGFISPPMAVITLCVVVAALAIWVFIVTERSK